MRVSIVGNVRRDSSEVSSFPFSHTEDGVTKTIWLPVSEGDGIKFDPEDQTPVAVIIQDDSSDGLWYFRGRAVVVKGSTSLPREEVVTRIKHAVIRVEKDYNRISNEVSAFENMKALASAPREPIAQAVRLFVWQRDQGKCVRCGIQERLEFDHIIPVCEGGSSTERNIQLLCERCNREKGVAI
jgi:5-methylcytosine-specific restriction endonuclease McrA